jgi:hypothetical protein
VIFGAVITAVTPALWLRHRAKARGKARVHAAQHLFPGGPHSVAEALKRIAAAGPGKLHILMDFDRTITMHWVDGEQLRPSMTSYGVLEHRFPPKEKAEVNCMYLRILHVFLCTWSAPLLIFCQIEALTRRFYPIETDPSLTRSEKAPFMVCVAIAALIPPPCYGNVRFCLLRGYCACRSSGTASPMNSILRPD